MSETVQIPVVTESTVVGEDISIKTSYNSRVSGIIGSQILESDSKLNNILVIQGDLALNTMSNTVSASINNNGELIIQTQLQTNESYSINVNGSLLRTLLTP